MTVHISVRLSWHDNGWNGLICSNPKENTFCVGPHSYPGDLIATDRKLSVEEDFRGKKCLEMFSKKGEIPPCCYSINAFGKDSIKAKAKPPEFFNDSTSEKIWLMPPSSVSTWPYEEMYKDEVKNQDGTYNNKRRREEANKFFAALEPKKTLIFYYANYSNPFSENEQNNYIIIGVSRLAAPAEDELLYDGCSKETKAKFAEGMLWQRVLVSKYPEEGFRIPYHLYRNKPEILERIGLVAENPRNFKYATRHISDDEALAIVEKLTEIAGTLQEVGDKTENWLEQVAWLNSLVAELWQERGKYPGVLKVMDCLGFKEIIPFYKKKILQDQKQEDDLKTEIFSLLKSEAENIEDFSIGEQRKAILRRQWKLKDEFQQQLLEKVLPRFDLSKDQMIRILDEERENYGLISSLEKIIKNPYILSEEYAGDSPDDFISFNKIDHGIFLSPDFENSDYADFCKDDPRRLRALCVEQLKAKSQHTFVEAKQIINGINHKLSYLPEWKRHHFNTKYLGIDRDVFDESLVLKDNKKECYLYLKSNFDYERKIEQEIRRLSERKDIEIKNPVTLDQWHSWLYSQDNPICKLDPKKYTEIVNDEAAICEKIFKKPVSVINGGAGTGKTTIVGALIKAIEATQGKGVCIQLLCPTGKATDRLRELTNRQASTVHSFLASHDWLNENLTFKLKGPEENSISAIIIDESSMLDLPLLGTLFRSINWASIKRLIFVGDPNQLPPIGTGKVFADIVDWLQSTHPQNVGFLKNNVRQLANQLEGKGTGILDLASLYLRKVCEETKNSEEKFREEQILQKIHRGNDVDKDLRVIFWKGQDDLYNKILSNIVSDIEAETGLKYDPEKPFEIWGTVFKIYHAETGDYDFDKPEPDYLQLISPYRGEFFGIDGLNAWLQLVFNSENVINKGTLGGVTFFDKVLQYRNRTRSNPIGAWDTKNRVARKIEVFNGEIGFTKFHAFDSKRWFWKNFRPLRFQVIFKRKEHLWVDYNSKTDVEENIELAYAISVHKSQGSEFSRVCLILPKHKKALLTTELFYTGLTRAKNHCTIFIEEDIGPLLTLNRPEYSQLNRINSSLFEFKPVPEELTNLYEWYEEGKIHRTLAEIMVHSKSEVIIANMLFDRKIPFKYDIPLFAPDGTFYRPDFVITWNGEEWYWEHLGMLDKEDYKNHWEAKKEWYQKNGFSNKLITTEEKGGLDSKTIEDIIQKHFRL